jgi:hypothetical protein
MEQRMRSVIVATAILSLAFAARANDVADSSLKTKALAAAAVVSPAPRTVEAPFTSSSVRDPLPQLLLAEEQDRRSLRGTCEAAATELCFDAADGRITYRGARKYMPAVDGLTPESVSVRGHRLNFKYSFK